MVLFFPFTLSFSSLFYNLFQVQVTRESFVGPVLLLQYKLRHEKALLYRRQKRIICASKLPVSICFCCFNYSFLFIRFLLSVPFIHAIELFILFIGVTTIKYMSMHVIVLI